MENIAYFELPEFYKYQNVYDMFLKFVESENFCISNRAIESIYGCFPGMVWNGGRVCISKYKCSEQEIRDVFELYKSHNISLTLTNTNLWLDEYYKDISYINDEYCNMIMKIGNEYKCNCLVINKNLEKHIRENYKNISIIKSITHNFVKTEDLDSYKYFVVSNFKNKDFDYLNKLDVEKVILLCNSNCDPKCKLCSNHYKYISKCQLKQIHDNWNCFADYQENFIKPNDIEKYLEIGINKFKLNYRETCMHEETFRWICNFLIQYEYIDMVKELLLNEYDNNPHDEVLLC